MYIYIAFYLFSYDKFFSIHDASSFINDSRLRLIEEFEVLLGFSIKTTNIYLLMLLITISLVAFVIDHNAFT